MLLNWPPSIATVLQEAAAPLAEAAVGVNRVSPMGSSTPWQTSLGKLSVGAPLVGALWQGTRGAPTPDGRGAPSGTSAWRRAVSKAPASLKRSARSKAE